MADERGRLMLRWREGEAAQAGQLDDYAVYSLSLIELYRLTFDVFYLQKALERARQMVELFEDREQGGYFITASDAERLIARPKETYDGALPSGNSAAAAVLYRLAALTGEPFWRQAADRQGRFLSGEIHHYPAGYGFALTALGNELYPHRGDDLCGTRYRAGAIQRVFKEKSGRGLEHSGQNQAKRGDSGRLRSLYQGVSDSGKRRGVVSV